MKFHMIHNVSCDTRNCIDLYVLIITFSVYRSPHSLLWTTWYTIKDMKGHHSDPDLLLIDKPAGITSFDVIRRLRKEYPGKKMGHAGTLDPFATGLLLVGIGKGTERLRHLVGLDKTYEAEVLLGMRTVTGDPDGTVVEEASVPELDFAHVRHIVENLRGALTLPVPAYSAVKVKGERLYALARRDQSPKELPMKPMEIRRIELCGMERKGNGYRLALVLDVASGTYIRSVAEELGKRLGYPASVAALRRTRVGEYTLHDAVTLEKKAAP